MIFLSHSSVIGGKSRFGQPTGEVNNFRNARLADDTTYLWTETATVPEKVMTVPDELALVRFPSGVSVRPNDTFTTGLVRLN